jgi:Uma2 family endonuclease
VLMVIEVADTSRDYDRNAKFPRYGAAGIPEAWLFDLVGERIERHTEPGPHGYRQIALAGRGETLTSTVLPGLTFAADALLA